jgi:hypothetical protein
LIGKNWVVKRHRESSMGKATDKDGGSEMTGAIHERVNDTREAGATSRATLRDVDDASPNGENGCVRHSLDLAPTEVVEVDTARAPLRPDEPLGGKAPDLLLAQLDR